MIARAQPRLFNRDVEWFIRKNGERTRLEAVTSPGKLGRRREKKSTVAVVRIAGNVISPLSCYYQRSVKWAQLSDKQAHTGVGQKVGRSKSERF